MKHMFSLAAAAILWAAPAAAQMPPGGPDPEMLRQIREAEAAYYKLPDTQGSGAYPALKEADRTLPAHVVYRPADLAKLGKRKLGIVAWGNGGCGADGANSRLHLAEIASHGYLVIANGTILSGHNNPPPPMPMPMPEPGKPFVPPPPATSAEQLVQSIDWAIAENGRKGSPYYGKIDTKAVAVSGWSCGGLQAIKIAASDPRVKTAVIHNSGIFAEPRPGMDVSKDALGKLHAPIVYILGGPTDIAYANGMDDYARISSVPVAVANRDVGHGGTFYQPNGGAAAQLAIAWLEWQLRGDAKAGAAFAGTPADPAWKIEHKGF